MDEFIYHNLVKVVFGKRAFAQRRTEMAFISM